MAAIIALALALGPAVLAQTGRQTFFPPNLNSTSYITDTNGTYGGIYQADTFNGTSYDPAYGTYDVCIPYHDLSNSTVPTPPTVPVILLTTTSVLFHAAPPRHRMGSPLPTPAPSSSSSNTCSVISAEPCTTSFPAARTSLSTAQTSNRTSMVRQSRSWEMKTRSRCMRRCIRVLLTRLSMGIYRGAASIRS